MSSLRNALLALLMLVPCEGWADVAMNSSGTPSNNAAPGTAINVDTITIAAGSNQCLIAFLITNGATTDNAVEWDSAGTPQAMTLVTGGEGGLVTNGNNNVRVYVLANPTVGNKRLRATWTTSVNARLAGVAFSGAASDCGDNADAHIKTGTGTSATTDATTSTATGATVAGLSAIGGGTPAETAGYTSLYTNGTSPSSAVSYQLGGTSNTHSWSITSTTWATVSIHLSAAVGSSGVNCTLLGVC